MGLDNNNTLTFSKLKKLWKDLTSRQNKFDKDWYCPLKEEGDDRYFVSNSTYSALNEEFKKHETFYNKFNFHTYSTILGITIYADNRIANDDSKIYYEDKEDNLQPVLKFDVDKFKSLFEEEYEKGLYKNAER